ncbi:unnamed protein product [Allacma fusca]|uniref:Uncharacterized protein n=1 Tax=Allacma fusca TaxID=39272 RepID=A0A8J2Q0P2_9HEXA|nr:unnamed protein product [Allacma fusca]
MTRPWRLYRAPPLGQGPTLAAEKAKMNLTADEVQKMKVVELRAELTSRGLDNRGVKAVLTERLLAALEPTAEGSSGGLGNGSSGEVVTGNGDEVSSSPDKVIDEPESPVKETGSESPAKVANAESPVKAANAESPVKAANAESPVKVVNAESPVKVANAESPDKVTNAETTVKSPTPSNPPAQVQSSSPTKPTPLGASSPVKTSPSPAVNSVSPLKEVPVIESAVPPEQSESSQEKDEDSIMEEAEGEETADTEDTAGNETTEDPNPEDNGEQPGDESMEVDEETNKRKIDDVNGEGEEAEGDVATPDKKRAKKEEVKIIPEHEPEFDSTKVLLDWYKSDLNLNISEENFLEATPWNVEEFPFAYAGVKATHGFNQGKVYYEVKWEDSAEVKLDFGEEEKKYVLRVGWSDLSAGLQLGQEKLSYCWDSSGKIYKSGETEDFSETFDKGDVVGVSLNLDADPVELKFTKNGAIVGTTVEIPKENLLDKTLFPHILSRNVKFSVNFGDSETAFTPEEGYALVSKVEEENRVRGPSRAETKDQCEFVLLCGLAGCGKTKWSKDYVENNVDKNYNILGTSILVERSLQNQQILGSSSTSRTYDGFFQKAGKFVEKLIEIAPSRRRNYILDQSNVVAGAQRRKSSGFQGFIRRAVVIVPSDEEYQNRIKAKEQEQGKSVPKSTILDMKAGFRLPEVGEIFSAVDFADLDREEAQKLISKYNKDGQNAGFGRPIPSRGGGMGRFGRGRGRGGPPRGFRGGGGGWRGRGGPMGPRGGPHFGGPPRGGPRGMPPAMRGGPRGGGPPRGGSGGPPRPPRGGGPPRGGVRGGNGPPPRGGGGGSWRGGSPGTPQRSFQHGRGPKRDNSGRGGGSWRGGNGNIIQGGGRGGGYGPGGGRGQQSQGPPFQNWGQNWGPPARSGGGGFGGGGFSGDPWQQVPDQGFGQSWDSSGSGGGRAGGGGTWQGYGGQTFGNYGGSGGRR